MRHHEREAEIVAQADAKACHDRHQHGRPGTDILLGGNAEFMPAGVRKKGTPSCCARPRERCSRRRDEKMTGGHYVAQ